MLFRYHRPHSRLVADVGQRRAAPCVAFDLQPGSHAFRSKRTLQECFYGYMLGLELCSRALCDSLTFQQHIRPSQLLLYHSLLDTITQHDNMDFKSVAVLLLIIGTMAIYFSRRSPQSLQKLSKTASSLWSHTSNDITTKEKTSMPPPLQAFKLPSLKPRASSRMAMGLKRLDESNWLTLDSCYLSEQ